MREIVPQNELGMIVSNIGITPDFSAIYTPNSAPHTAFVQVSLKEDHKVGSYEYMSECGTGLRNDMPAVQHLFPIGRAGGCRAQHGHAGADRRPGQRHNLEQSLRKPRVTSPSRFARLPE